ncbi:MAG: hypothetical protein AAGF11_16350 [Myxococcota bacterium]
MTASATGPDPAAGMHVVAIQHRLPRAAGRSRLDDDWVRARAEAVGVTFYELRARLRVLDGWPGVLGTYAGARPAGSVAAALRREGIAAWVLGAALTEPRTVVRRFWLRGGRLVVEADGGGSFELHASDVRMLVHGVQMSEDRTFVLSRPVHAPALRVASGGVVPQSRTRSTRESFVELYAPGCPILSFRAASLRYAALSDGVVEPTRVANFQRVVHTLRTGCPAATYDARLRGRIEQMRVLGPSLRPELHLSLAVALVAGRRPDPSPYR